MLVRELATLCNLKPIFKEALTLMKAAAQRRRQSKGRLLKSTAISVSDVRTVLTNLQLSTIPSISMTDTMEDMNNGSVFYSN